MNITEPIREIPPELMDAFTLDGKMAVTSYYDNAATDEIQALISANFTQQNLQSSIERTARRDRNYYGTTDEWLYQALEKYPVKGLSVCLIGSTFPWYEGMMITYGAARIDVSEYSDRSLEHPKLSYLKPDEIEGNQWDMCVSISSFEHDGLGRYGDPIDPDGDLKAMKAMKKVVKPGGLMLLAVPVGRDLIVFNRHRVYGEHRLPLLLEEWEEVESFGFSEPKLDFPNNGEYQPVFVLRNS